MICTRCRQERGTDFPPAAKIRREKATKEYQKYHTWCRPCHNEVKKESDLAMGLILASYKRKPCMDCKRTYPPLVMDFDHRPDTVKLFTIGAMRTSRSLESVIAEIAKCDIVCGNCHRIRTWNRRHPDNPILNEDIVRTSTVTWRGWQK